MIKYIKGQGGNAGVEMAGMLIGPKLQLAGTDNSHATDLQYGRLNLTVDFTAPYSMQTAALRLMFRQKTVQFQNK